jgi:hypothetical protein
MRRFAFVVALLSAVQLSSVSAAEPAAAVTQTPDSTAFRADIRKLLKLTGSDKLALQMMDQLMASFRNASPDVPPEFWDSFAREINGDELIEKIIPVYERNLTHEDVKGLIAFYETPLGAKVISTMPTITQESMGVGQEWGTELAQKALMKMEDYKATQSAPAGKSGKGNRK